MTYPPPASLPPSPVTQQPTRNTKKIVLVIVGVVAALCLVCAGVGYGIFRYVTNSTQPQRDAVHAFLRNLENGDVSGAYDELCASTRGEYSEDEFTRVVAGQPRLSSHEIVAFEFNSVNGATTGTVTATLNFVDGSTERHVFDMTLDDDGWHVCGDPY